MEHISINDIDRTIDRASRGLPTNINPMTFEAVVRRLMGTTENAEGELAVAEEEKEETEGQVVLLEATLETTLNELDALLAQPRVAKKPLRSVADHIRTVLNNAEVR